MPLDWGQLVSQLTNVQKLVHLAARRDPIDVDSMRTSLLREMRRVYEAELTDMAARVGCRGRRGRNSPYRRTPLVFSLFLYPERLHSRFML